VGKTENDLLGMQYVMSVDSWCGSLMLSDWACAGKQTVAINRQLLLKGFS
jgi:hypothetical protein